MAARPRIDHWALVGGWAPSVIVGAIARGLNIAAIVLFALYVLYLIWYFWRGRGSHIEHVPDPTVHGPVGVLFTGSSHADHSVLTVTVNGERPPPPTAPPQVPITPEERDEIRAELLRVVPLLQALTAIWYADPLEAMRQSGGTQEDGYEWRDQHDAEVTQRYVNEVYPSVVAVYQRGRVRGFFEPEIERIYESTMFVQVNKLPALFTQLAARLSQ